MRTYSFTNISIIGLVLSGISALITYSGKKGEVNKFQLNTADNGILIANSNESVGGDFFATCILVATGPFNCHFTNTTASSNTDVTSLEFWWPYGFLQTIGNTSISNPNNQEDTTSQPGLRSAT
ncbi:MAG: hypothetical protein P0Y53_23435 [Candidatus Pseudobacter hemicellulosilyticus]|uniref:Uncharacterized protein n=1 Tax=Candidatus Pseudobacter hemicellulosilyticus TaxID=3121375 RepID=A0AAJ5WNZ1_9BACT|nr:MAG: hypothetical protein P0Y53_23435 [Pseudobacter sp.]